MIHMQGEFTSKLPHREMNINNLTLDCKCNFITLKEMGNGKMQFLMEPKCLKHLLKYAEWKLLNRVVQLRNLQISYKWNEYSDGTTGIIK